MRVVYSPGYEIDIGAHVWPTAKYRHLRDRLASNPQFAFCEPQPATWDQLALVHFPVWLQKLRDCALTPAEEAQLEIPWNASIAAGFLRMAGGTILATRLAVEEGLAIHLGGGLHHAFPGHGEGFCPLNDVAVAIRALQYESRVRRAAVIDCDVHQGNGTAVCFAGDDVVFTFSIHQEHNYPQWKPKSDLDIGVRDRTTDGEYLEQLQEGIEAVLAHGPELVVYLAGADPFQEDQLGGLSLTKDGLRRRDRAVLQSMRWAGMPVAIVLAGGYARRLQDTIDIHAATAEEALALSARGI
ncbi:MAG TPA: histone deacetylase [Vicinamibacterales bacterium]|nr:histone deacetylase [Vicinamibacterales bacterium]